MTGGQPDLFHQQYDGWSFNPLTVIEVLGETASVWLPGTSLWPFWDGENMTLSKVVGDLEPGDEKVILNHLVIAFFFISLEPVCFV